MNKIKYEDLPMCTEEESEVFLDKARKFLDHTTLYKSYTAIAVCAIADYLASTMGKQLKRK